MSAADIPNIHKLVSSMFKTYRFFDYRDLEDLVPEFLYYYLFQGLSLKVIEEKYYGSQEYKGWLCKSLLNYYGVDTDGENRGLYNERSIQSVVDELYTSTDMTHLRIAHILKKKYL